MNNKTSERYSWPLIIVLLFIFWPVGLYMLYKKAETDKKTALTAATVLNVLGTILIVLGAILLIVIIGIIYLIPGIILKKLSKKLKRNAELTRKYLAIVINSNVRQLDLISTTVGKPYDKVKEDLQKMIDNGYFKNAYINEAAREIVIAAAAPQPTYEQQTYAPAATAVTTRVISCPCCGANNTITGAVGECEYCGSPLS